VYFRIVQYIIHKTRWGGGSGGGGRSNSVKRYVFYGGAILFHLGFTAINIKSFLTKHGINIQRFVSVTCSAFSSIFVV